MGFIRQVCSKGLGRRIETIDVAILRSSKSQIRALCRFTYFEFVMQLSRENAGAAGHALGQAEGGKGVVSGLVTVRSNSSAILCQPSDCLEVRHHNEIR